MADEVSEAIRGMPSGTHAVLVYDSQRNKRDVLFRHLKAGVESHGLVYVCSEESPSSIRSGLRTEGVDVGGLEREDLLAVKKSDEVYIVDGEVDAPGIISTFSSLAWGYRRRGYGGVRAAAEMSCFFRERKVEELVGYENALHRKFDFPGIGVCAYNLVEMGNSDNLDVLWPILKAHKLVIMTGPNGSFAREPEAFNSRDIDRTMGTALSLPS